jgi:hypothetical protein
LRELATRTSWPHSSITLLTQGEWVPVSIAMHMGCSEAKRRLIACGVVRRADPPRSAHRCRRPEDRDNCISVAEIQSGRHLWSFFVTIHLGPILLSILGVRARRTVADPLIQGTAYGGRPSHLIFRELHKRCELRRIPQRVEEVGVELMATKNRSRNALKPVCLVADLGRKRAPGGFFNKLTPSTHSGE